MPTVPQYQQRVQETALPTPGVRSVGGAELFGGGPAAANASEALRSTITTFEKAVLEEKKKADQLAVLDADRQLSAAHTKLLYDPKEGALTKTGKDSFGLPESTMEQFGKIGGEIYSKLSNDDQRLAFQKMQVSRTGELDRAVQSHVSSQIQKYDDETTESYLANERDAAAFSFSDPDRVQMAIERQRAAIVDYATRNGKPEEYVKLKAMDAGSKTHSVVVTRMLSNGRDLDAKDYYAKNREFITGADAMSLDKALEEGSLRGESQRQSDAIMATAEDRSTALEKARGIEEPKLRDAVEERINKSFSERKQAETEFQNDLYLQSTNVLDANVGRTAREVIAPDVWSKMTLAQREALQNRSEDVPNNNKVWLDFLDMSTDQMGSLNRAEFETKYWSTFDKSHRSRAETMWNAALDAKKKGTKDPQLSATLTFNERVNDALRTSGMFDPNKPRAKWTEPEATLFARFEQAAARQVEHFELTDLGGKRKATGNEIQKIVDDLTTKKVFVDRWGRDLQKPAAVLTDEERAVSYVPLDNIPTEDRNSIERVILSKKRPANKDKIQRAYAAYVMGDRSTFLKIVGE